MYIVNLSEEYVRAALELFCVEDKYHQQLRLTLDKSKKGSPKKKAPPKEPSSGLTQQIKPVAEVDESTIKRPDMSKFPKEFMEMDADSDGLRFGITKMGDYVTLKEYLRLNQGDKMIRLRQVSESSLYLLIAILITLVVKFLSIPYPF